MNNFTTYNDYIVNIMDLQNQNKQCGIFYLVCSKSIDDITFQFGASSLLQQTMGIRWAVHIQPVGQADARSTKRVQKEYTTVAVMRQIIMKLKMLNITPNSPILLPANIER